MTLLQQKQKANLMRRTTPTAIIHSGGKQTIFGCICGARHTCATNYRQAKHVSDWCARHNKECSSIFNKLLSIKALPITALADAVYSNDEH